MFCPTGSTASGITVCWQAPVARPISRRSAPCSGCRNLRQRPKLRLNPHPCPCANHAPVVARRCGSSRSSGADRRRVHGHHRGSRPHDETPISLPGPPPVPAWNRRGPDLRATERIAKFGRRSPAFEAQSSGNWRKKPSCRRAPRTPVAACAPDRPHRRRSFSIGSASPPAASSFRGLSTWTATTRRPLLRCGPRRKTFREADGGRAVRFRDRVPKAAIRWRGWACRRTFSSLAQPSNSG